MTRMLTIISGAGIMVLSFLPVCVLLRLHEVSRGVETDTQNLVGAKALLVSLIVLGVSVFGAMGLIVIRLVDRRIRG